MLYIVQKMSVPSGLSIKNIYKCTNPVEQKCCNAIISYALMYLSVTTMHNLIFAGNINCIFFTVSLSAKQRTKRPLFTRRRWFKKGVILYGTDIERERVSFQDELVSDVARRRWLHGCFFRPELYHVLAGGHYVHSYRNLEMEFRVSCNNFVLISLFLTYLHHCTHINIIIIITVRTQ